MKKMIAHLVWDDQGQDLIEYVLIGSFVSIGVLARRDGSRHVAEWLVRQGGSLGERRDRRWLKAHVVGGSASPISVRVQPPETCRGLI